MNVKNSHLIISTLIVPPIALVYGCGPNMVFDVLINSVDESNIFKAIMGLYLGFSLLWILGIFKLTFWEAATVSNMIFMFGLAFGRLISVFFDGMPSTIFIIGTIGELVLGLFAYYQLKRHSILSK